MDSDGPIVTIVFVGDPSCGKTTFLSKLSLGASTLTEPITPSFPLPHLRDHDQPYVFNIRMYNRPYRFEMYDTASPENYTLLKPNFVIMCYDISDRKSLTNVGDVWSQQVARIWLREKDDIPVMLLGLKRDLRVEDEGVVYPQEVCTRKKEFNGL